jgi:hypothetical protein
MQAMVDSTMPDTVVACNNCRDLLNQLYETRQRIAQFTRSELCQNAYYREQLNDEIKKQQIAEQSLVYEFKCHQYTEINLQDTKKALAYEQKRNTMLLAIVQKQYLHHPLTAPELDTMMKQHLQPFIDALQHPLKGPKEVGEGEGLRGNRELDEE